jgi:hypothetical protein
MEVQLHASQSLVYEDDHRFKVVAAGRRFGKSYLAAVLLYIEGSKTHKTLSDGTEISLATEDVYYVGPTFKQARENLWSVMMDMGQGLIKSVRANEGEITLTNGRLIRFKGADDPDSLRGVGLSYCIMDEYAFMKPSAWEYIILPALTRAEGGALFIGTPAGKNHFYNMWTAAGNGFDPSSGKKSDQWVSFQFTSRDNPHLTANAVQALLDCLTRLLKKHRLKRSMRHLRLQEARYSPMTSSRSARAHFMGRRYLPVTSQGLKRQKASRRPNPLWTTTPSRWSEYMRRATILNVSTTDGGTSERPLYR